MCRDPRGHTDEARDTASVSDMEQVTSDLRGVTVYLVGSAQSGSSAARFLHEGQGQVQ